MNKKFLTLARKFKIAYLVLISRNVMMVSDKGAGLLIDVKVKDIREQFSKLTDNLKELLSVAHEEAGEFLKDEPIKKARKEK